MSGRKRRKRHWSAVRGGGQFELMLQVEELFPELLIISIFLLRSGIFQQACLSQEEDFYLEKVVAMLVYRTERQATGPRFKGVSVQSETEVAGKGDKEYIFPMMIATLQAGGNGTGLLLEALHLQGRQTGMHGQLRQGAEDGVAGRIYFRPAQLVVVAEDVFGTMQEQLGDGLPVGEARGAILLAHHVEDDVVICLVAVVPVAKPVGGLRVYLDVAHPERTVYFQFGVKEIGACVHVRQTGIYHFDRLSGGRL